MTIKSVRITSIIICVFLAMVINGLAIWQYFSYIEVEKEAKAHKKELADLKADVENTKRMLASFEKEKEDFEEILFDERDIPAFLDKISKFAKEEAIDIISMRAKSFYQVRLPDEVSDRRSKMMRARSRNQSDIERKREELKRILTLAAMPIDIKITGKFKPLIEFLNRFPSYKQLTNIGDLEIERNSDDYPELKCHFELKIYSLKSLDQFADL